MEAIIAQVLSITIVAAIGWIAASVSRWAKAQKGKADAEKADIVWGQALDALDAGVAKAEKDFVELAKAASADGKLSKDEKKQAEEIAKRNALEVAIGLAPAAAQLLLKLSAEAISALIKGILSREKKK